MVAGETQAADGRNVISETKAMVGRASMGTTALRTSARRLLEGLRWERVVKDEMWHSIAVITMLGRWHHESEEEKKEKRGGVSALCCSLPRSRRQQVSRTLRIETSRKTRKESHQALFVYFDPPTRALQDVALNPVLRREYGSILSVNVRSVCLIDTIH